MHQHPERRIWHFWLGDDGNPVSDDWPSFFSHDNSVANLRAQVARLEHDENITLGVRAGYNARVIPLVTNLPNNGDPMQIIVYTTGSPGENSAAFAVVCAALVICFSPFQHVRCIEFSACNGSVDSKFCNIVHSLR